MDLQLDSGEFFLNEAQRDAKKRQVKQDAAKSKATEKKVNRMKEFQPPAELDSANMDVEVGGSNNKKRKKHLLETAEAPVLEPPTAKDKKKKKVRKDDD